MGKGSGNMYHHAPSGYVMFVAFVGALVYFINQAEGFTQVLFAFVQAAVWPGILLYRILQVLGVG
ncbi:hypothetical protein KDA14_03535 [Candidatus Saccharibacteria bacterium]|nr:hypothetical protein [Candidatus Saccharibacteria bacterium]